MPQRGAQPESARSSSALDILVERLTLTHLERDAAGHRLLTEMPPTGPAAKYADSPALSRSNGNPWREIGTWRTGLGTFEGRLAEVHDLEIWLGLRNSDDQGTSVDVRADLFIDGTVMASGEAVCVSGLTRNPARAKAVSIELGLDPGADSLPGDLALTVSARIGTGDCHGHASASGVRLYYGSAPRDSRFSVVPEL